MTYEMKKTRLEGFPVQYEQKVVQHLNEIVNCCGNINNHMLDEIGKRVSPDVKHSMLGATITEDGYIWFGTLEYKVDNARIAILFPRHQDWDHPETKMDRSINVYSDKEIPVDKVKELLDKLVVQHVSVREKYRKNEVKFSDLEYQS